MPIGTFVVVETPRAAATRLGSGTPVVFRELPGGGLNFEVPSSST
jgi:hypothetical protein